MIPGVLPVVGVICLFTNTVGSLILCLKATTIGIKAVLELVIGKTRFLFLSKKHIPTCITNYDKHAPKPCNLFFPSCLETV